jgi:O-antigen ligase
VVGRGAGALAALPFIAWQRLGLGIERPGGLINSITFGDLSLLLGLLAMAGSLDPAQPVPAAVAGRRRRTGRHRGFRHDRFPRRLDGAAAVALALLPRLRGLGVRHVGALLGASAVLLAAVWFAPGLGMHARFDGGVEEAQTWHDGIWSGPMSVSVWNYGRAR